MVKVTVSNNTKKNDVLVPVTATLREVANEAGVNLGSGGMYINGELINQSFLDSTLESLHVQDESEAMLIAVKNADSAR